ncbi:hypothetical protein JCM3770_000350 [Rhodotorula araucariae]
MQVFRGSGVRMAHLSSAWKGDICQAGQWNSQVMERRYLTTLPRQVMCVHAGFDAAGGTFFLKRDIAVPDELIKQVFPEANEWLHRMDNHDQCKPSIAVHAFLMLRNRLRPVLLQDAACLRRIYPQHPVFLHQLFTLPASHKFDLQLVAQMDTSFKAQAQTSAELSVQFTQMGSTIVKEVQGLRCLLTDCLTGGISLRLAADHLHTHNTHNTALAGTSIPACPGPLIRMSRTITTVDQAVREWQEGLGGGPSVVEAYKVSGAGHKRMREEGAQNKHYRRHLKIIEKIGRIMQENGVAQEVAVRLLEAYRGERLLAKLQDELSKSPLVAIPLK